MKLACVALLLVVSQTPFASVPPKKRKAVPTRTPTSTVTPTASPTATPTAPPSVDQKKYEAVYRAAKAVDLAMPEAIGGRTSARLKRLTDDFELELQIAEDKPANDLEHLLTKAYRRALAKAVGIPMMLSADEAMRESQREIDRYTGGHSRSSSTAFDYRKAASEFTAALREAEAIYLGKPVTPTAASESMALSEAKGTAPTLYELRSPMVLETTFPIGQPSAWRTIKSLEGFEPGRPLSISTWPAKLGKEEAFPNGTRSGSTPATGFHFARKSPHMVSGGMSRGLGYRSFAKYRQDSRSR